MNALCALLQQSGTSVLRLGRWYENDPVQSLLVGFMCKNNGLEMKDFLASFVRFHGYSSAYYVFHVNVAVL